MKTYFMAWESDNKRGSSMYDFDDSVKPRDAFAEMMKEVQNNAEGSVGSITASQFNLIEKS